MSAHPLVEQIRIDAAVGEPLHAVLELVALARDGVGQRMGLLQLLIELHPGEEPALALDRVIAEIGEQAKCPAPVPLPGARDDRCPEQLS